MNHEGHPPSEPALGLGNRGREVLHGENARTFIYDVSSTLVHFLALSCTLVLARSRSEGYQFEKHYFLSLFQYVLEFQTERKIFKSFD